MNQILSFMLLLNLMSAPVDQNNVVRYNNEKKIYEKKTLDIKRQNIQDISKYYNEIKKKAEDAKNDITKKNNPFNYDLIKYIGRQKGYNIVELLEVSLAKNREAKRGLGLELEIQFNDLIAQRGMSDDEYTLYVDRMIKEVDTEEMYIVGFEYYENSNISTVIILKESLVK